MMLKTFVSALTASMLFVMSAYGAGAMKAGLWEVTTQSAAMKNMPKVPPEQIEQMRKMGVDISQLQSGAIVSKICITKDMAQRNQLPMDQALNGCKTGSTKQSASGYTTDIVCKGPEMKGKGLATVSFASDESFSTSTEFQGTINGQPISDRSDTSGKWISTGCGSVKPIAPETPKK
jgi:hypothetical protein